MNALIEGEAMERSRPRLRTWTRSVLAKGQLLRASLVKDPSRGSAWAAPVLCIQYCQYKVNYIVIKKGQGQPELSDFCVRS
jgi:hypothetical protein